MKNPISTLVVLGLAATIFFGCTEEQQQQNCLVGTWRNNSGNCHSDGELIFNSNGTAIINKDNCDSICFNGEEWYSTAHVDYIVSESGLTLTFTQALQCDSAIQVTSVTQTIPATCDGDVLDYNGTTFLRQ